MASLQERKRSQMVAAFLDVVKEMYAGLRSAFRQPLSRKLTNHTLISQLANQQESTIAEAMRAVTTSCDELIRNLGITEMPR